MTTIMTADGLKTWKGDPTDITAIAVWKQSYEPGYSPQLISPRDSAGNYTDDPDKMVTHAIITKEQQAKEIVYALKGETTVPEGIIQSLAKTLGGSVDKLIHHEAPTAITDTKRITGDDTIQSRLTNVFKGKITAVTVAVFVIIFFSLKLIKTK